MTDDAPEVVWRGAEALRPFLVAITDLYPFDRNPRRGAVAEIRPSIRRFGQTRPILTDAADSRRIVAGHHVVMAAADEGFTHVAAIPNEFAGEGEARAYLLADNRTHDKGTYDLDALYEHLREVQGAEAGLEGTGYDADYMAQLRRDLDAQEAAARPPEEFPSLDPDELVTEHQCPSCGYEWSGNPAPGKAAEEPATESGE